MIFITTEKLKILNTDNINNFSYMSNGCKFISNLSGLENLDVSLGNNLYYKFSNCLSLANLCLKILECL